MSRRGPQEGSVYQRSDGLWVGALHLGFKNGKRQRKSVYARTQREALDKLRVVQEQVRAGLPVSSDRLTLGDFLLQWLDDAAKPSVRARTYSSYEQIVRVHLRPGLGQVQLAKLTPQQVQQFLNAKRSDGLSPRTVAYLRAVLRQALNVGLRWGLVSRNAASLAVAPKVETRPASYLTNEQARAFLSAIRGHRLEALYTVALALGLRQGEALGLRWTDVDLEGPSPSITVRRQLSRIGGRPELVEPKTARSKRTIAVPLVVANALRTHRVRQLEERLISGSRWDDWGLVFTTTVGTPLDGSRVTRDLQRVLAGAGLPRMRFHDLRHSCASLLAAQGVPARVTMEILGHSDIRTTMNIYTHVAPDVHREAIERIQAALST